jgi:hypothetical protein
MKNARAVVNTVHGTASIRVERNRDRPIRVLWWAADDEAWRQPLGADIWYLAHRRGEGLQRIKRRAAARMHQLAYILYPAFRASSRR